jgi:hypothetical protein
MTRLEADRDRHNEIHERWRDRKNCDQNDPAYHDGSNARSPFDKTVMFEHDGCDEFEGNGEWG